jgi:molybdate transport system ATP-binding protein
MILARIRKRFPAGQDSAGFSLDIAFQTSSGITVLFGPSGAGKTLTLDCIAGFVRPDEGRILLDDEILFDAVAGVHLPPRVRRCGYVFQNYALFPHMTLRENLEFAAQRGPRTERRRRIGEMLERFHLSDVGGRRPHELSGGQKQRCSIARALIGAPKLLLLDEPARGLDAPLRAELYVVLRQVRAEFGTPVLLVTHDLNECFELGDEMLVVRDGRLVQTGTPRKVLEQPANVEVARLLGSFNVLPAEILALDPARNLRRIRIGEFDLAGPYFPGRLLGDRIWLCVRPSLLAALARNGRPGPNQIPAQLIRVADGPQTVRLEFSGGISVEMSQDEYQRQRQNREWLIEFPPQALQAL